jgi:phospho-N-acetylmuramoyl-pentapeptide-transferase
MFRSLVHAGMSVWHSYLTCSVGVRASVAVITAFCLTLVYGAFFIGNIASLTRAGVREYTPEKHKQKGQTPSMGGLFVIVAILCTCLIWVRLSDPKVLVILLALISFGLIGLWDDLSKIAYKKGISEQAKFGAQLAAAAGCVVLWGLLDDPSTVLVIPFFQGFAFDLKFLFVLWAMWIMLSSTNAVNLTDGLDGLATSILIPVLVTFVLIALLSGDVLFAGNYAIVNSDNTELIIAVLAIVGALMGFLWFNAYPAQVFMGDVGSLALGAVLALVALMTKFELLLPIAGGVFVFETLSVMIQVFCNKRWGWRPFRIAPYHHHLEMCGMPETKITARLTLVTLLLCFFALVLCPLL